jgi:AcrR family transcriptional regulator
MPGAWLREEQAGLAVDKILAAAAQAFVDLGVSRAGMGHIARYAGCSRGTLYRYFKNRHELHLAYVNRTAVEIADRLSAELAAIADPEERLIEGIVGAVRLVRSTPATAAWFAPGESGMAARMSRGSEVIESLSEAFVEKLLDPSGDDPESRLRARWLVRVVVSLLTMPGENEDEERALVARFIAPGLLGGNACRRQKVNRVAR